MYDTGLNDLEDLFESVSPTDVNYSSQGTTIIPNTTIRKNGWFSILETRHISTKTHDIFTFYQDRYNITL